MAASGAGRRRENQLHELILKPPLCYPPPSPDPKDVCLPEQDVRLAPALPHERGSPGGGERLGMAA
eukprot:9311613-Pyramimonas_sp.AAC.1